MLDIYKKPLGKFYLPINLRKATRLVKSAGRIIIYGPLPVEHLSIGEPLPSIQIRAHDLGLAFSADIEIPGNERILKGRRGRSGRRQGGDGRHQDEQKADCTLHVL